MGVLVLFAGRSCQDVVYRGEHGVGVVEVDLVLCGRLAEPTFGPTLADLPHPGDVGGGCAPADVLGALALGDGRDEHVEGNPGRLIEVGILSTNLAEVESLGAALAAEVGGLLSNRFHQLVHPSRSRHSHRSTAPHRVGPTNIYWHSEYVEDPENARCTRALADTRHLRIISVFFTHDAALGVGDS